MGDDFFGGPEESTGMMNGGARTESGFDEGFEESTAARFSHGMGDVWVGGNGRESVCQEEAPGAELFRKSMLNRSFQVEWDADAVFL